MYIKQKDSSVYVADAQGMLIQGTEDELMQHPAMLHNGDAFELTTQAPEGNEILRYSEL